MEKGQTGIELEETGISCLQTHSITPRPMQVEAIVVVMIAIFLTFQLIIIFAQFFSRPLAW